MNWSTERHHDPLDLWGNERERVKSRVLSSVIYSIDSPEWEAAAIILFMRIFTTVPQTTEAVTTGVCSTATLARGFHSSTPWSDQAVLRDANAHTADGRVLGEQIHTWWVCAHTLRHGNNGKYELQQWRCRTVVDGSGGPAYIQYLFSCIVTVTNPVRPPCSCLL